MRFVKQLALGSITVVLLAACGGGSEIPLKVQIKSVKVIGDSLSDSGTFNGIGSFGRVFSVQDSSTQIWPELVAASFGITSLCNTFKFTGATYVANTTPGCTNFAVGGALIQNTSAQGGALSPLSIPYQLVAAATTATTYSASDLLLIDGGGNDAAGLTGAILADQTLTAFNAFTANLGIAAAISQATAAARGSDYMKKLADSFSQSVKTYALDKGASRVVIVNLPGITNTPRFVATLNQISAAYGGGVAGAAAKTQTDQMVRAWIAAYNAQLATNFSGNSSVVIVDLNTEMDNQIANPAQYGLTNVTTPLCPSSGASAVTWLQCNATALSNQAPPAGSNGKADWWKTYAFSDEFHPTPYGHKLLAQLVNKSLVSAGWL
jgi:phospholipase/lecithinase/hemolysin